MLRRLADHVGIGFWGSRRDHRGQPLGLAHAKARGRRAGCARRRLRGARGLRPPHARPHGRLRQGRGGRGVQADHRRRRRGRAPAGHGGLDDRPAGAGRAGPLRGAVAAWICCCSIVQMPGGIPVGTLAIGPAGAKNAGILAARVLALSDKGLAERVAAYARPADRVGGGKRRRRLNGADERTRLPPAPRRRDRHPRRRPARPHAGPGRRAPRLRMRHPVARSRRAGRARGRARHHRRL